jgi:hypothetical protein
VRRAKAVFDMHGPDEVLMHVPHTTATERDFSHSFLRHSTF